MSENKDIKHAVVALIIKDGLILAISRRTDSTKFGLIGGKVDPNECLEDALIRETFEETGIKVIDFDLLHSQIEPGVVDGKDFYSHCYYINAWEDNLVPSDEGELRWLTVAELTNPNFPFTEFNIKTINIFKDKYPNIELRQ